MLFLAKRKVFNNLAVYFYNFMKGFFFKHFSQKGGINVVQLQKNIIVKESCANF